MKARRTDPLALTDISNDPDTWRLASGGSKSVGFVARLVDDYLLFNFRTLRFGVGDQVILVGKGWPTAMISAGLAD
jgi:hypothetical protein